MKERGHLWGLEQWVIYADARGKDVKEEDLCTCDEGGGLVGCLSGRNKCLLAIHGLVSMKYAREALVLSPGLY